MAAGVPALVTDTTPWRGAAARECGWCVSWERYAETLAAALESRPAALAAMGRRAREWMAADFSWERSARLLREFYAHLRDEHR
jgi:glycosyltransferase involved in cell wall biosynthesis